MKNKEHEKLRIQGKYYTPKAAASAVSKGKFSDRDVISAWLRKHKPGLDTSPLTDNDLIKQVRMILRKAKTLY